MSTPKNPQLLNCDWSTRDAGFDAPAHYSDITLRDLFAGMCQADDRLVKCIRSMDDHALEFFALHYDSEREEHITEIADCGFESDRYLGMRSEVQKVALRLEIEAKAIARVRYMQAEAMLAERARREGE